MLNIPVRIPVVFFIVFSMVCLSPVLAASGSNEQAGKISIRPVPMDASITIDGNIISTSPVDNYPVPYGTHNVTVSYPGYNDYTVEITVTADSSIFILTPVLTTSEKSYLVIATFPSGASIYLDGSYMGTTPDIGFQFMTYGNNFLLINDVPYGNYTVRASLPNYPDLTANISLVPPEGGMVYLNFGEATLSDTYGSVGLASDPEGARVSIDGVYKGETPLYLVNNVTAGKHQIRMIHDGYQEFATNLTVQGGKISSITVYLLNTSSASPTPASGKADVPVPVIMIALVLSLYFLGSWKKR
jgi:hypothetical protein